MTRTQAIFYSALGALSAAGSVLAQSLGGWDTMLQVLVTLMAIDYALGVVLALVWKRSNKTADGSFESRASVKGLFRKCGILLCVLIAARLDPLFGSEGYIAFDDDTSPNFLGYELTPTEFMETDFTQSDDEDLDEDEDETQTIQMGGISQ